MALEHPVRRGAGEEELSKVLKDDKLMDQQNPPTNWDQPMVQSFFFNDWVQDFFSSIFSGL